MTITRTARTAIIQHIAAATDYDASTARISHAGEVSALKDADKIFGGHDAMRYLVGHVGDLMVDAADRADYRARQAGRV